MHSDNVTCEIEMMPSVHAPLETNYILKVPPQLAPQKFSVSLFA
jgi:hypothetical protein